MRLCELQPIAKLAEVPVMESQNVPAALIDPQQFSSIAEATDTRRLFDLLHRQEYSPLAIVRFDNGDGSDEDLVRVYFQCKDSCGTPTMKQVPTAYFHQYDMQQLYLIADRDPAIREQVRRVLINRGHAAYVAADGLQCIEQLRQIAPTFLVLDPKIPWGGGDGVLEWIHDESPLNEVKVFLVDEGGSDCIHTNVAKQIAGRLHRPRNAEELVRFINELTSRTT